MLCRAACAHLAWTLAPVCFIRLHLGQFNEFLCDVHVRQRMSIPYRQQRVITSETRCGGESNSSLTVYVLLLEFEFAFLASDRASTEGTSSLLSNFPQALTQFFIELFGEVNLTQPQSIT